LKRLQTKDIGKWIKLFSGVIRERFNEWEAKGLVKIALDAFVPIKDRTILNATSENEWILRTLLCSLGI
jgi:hypothetical protein